MVLTWTLVRFRTILMVRNRTKGGYGEMFQESEVQQFNRLYKELDDLYHEIALAMGLSDSAFAVMYVVGTLGDGGLQRISAGRHM